MAFYRYLLFYVFLGIGFCSFAQISFEKGYFIDNLGQKTECLIKNIDWKNNPETFQYKISEHTEQKTAMMRSVIEFGIVGISKYERHNVAIDKSEDTEIISKLSKVREPIFKEERVFLKVLIAGKASLYSYEDGNLRRFFFKTDGSKVEQLIYKNYLVSSDQKAQNNQFKQQLWSSLNCSKISLGDVENLRYSAKALKAFFIVYNRCSNADYTVFDKKEAQHSFHITIRTGLKNSSLTVENGVLTWRNMDFGNQIGGRFGVELEYTLPFNKNKWAVFVEPTYQYFKAQTELAYLQNSPTTTNITVDYSSIEVPLGLRYYMFIDSKSRFFLNLAQMFDFPLTGSIKGENTNAINEEINSVGNLAFGLGYNFNNKYTIEARYIANRNILGNNGAWNANYKSISLIIGYSIL